MTVNGDSISVTYTSLAEIIGQKIANLNDGSDDPKTGERTTQNDLPNRYEEGHSDVKNEIIKTWQEWADGFQTLDDLQSVNLTPED